MSFINSKSVPVLTPTNNKIAPAYGLVIVGKSENNSSLASFAVKGVSVKEAFASLGLGDNNKKYLDTALAQVIIGLSSKGENFSSLDTKGRDNKVSLTTLDILNSSPPLRTAYYLLEIVKSNLYYSLAVLTISGVINKSADGSLQIVKEGISPALFYLAVSSGLVLQVLSSFDIGGGEKIESLGSLEVEDGEGVDLMIDIIDAILYEGHGDNC